MSVLFASLLACAIVFIAARERRLYVRHSKDMLDRLRDQDAMREDREVAILEAIFDREWER